jgi:excisionase family DNA binding protein
VTPDLARLLADPARAVDLPVEALPALLLQLGAEHHRLAAVEAAVAARLAGLPSPAPDVTVAPYTLAEAATLLGKSTAWVRRQARHGQLPGRKVGKSWVFPREDFDRARRRTRLGA